MNSNLKFNKNNNKINVNNIINMQNNFIFINKNKFIYDTYTKKGSNSTMPDKKNQDRFFIKLNINNNKNINLFGICDGHGIYGELVSEFIKNNLPKIIEDYFIIKNKKLLEEISIEKLIYSSVEKLVKKLSKSKINLLFSGSTLNFCLFIYDKIYNANVGDSRSIVSYKDIKNDNLIVKELSFDHKPNLKKEKERIIKAGGRVRKIIDDKGNKLGPYRVWLKDEEYPGLAMSRSIGDLVAFSVGVSWRPEISIYNINKQDEIVFLASDGVWEVLNNSEVINSIITFYENNKILKSTKKLSKLLDQKWQNELSIDDITFITIFLNK